MLVCGSLVTEKVWNKVFIIKSTRTESYYNTCTLKYLYSICLIYRSVRVAERLALPTSDHGVTGSNPTGGEILPEPKRRFIAQSLSCSPFHRLKMTEILLKGRKTLTHPSIKPYIPKKNQQKNTSYAIATKTAKDFYWGHSVLHFYILQWASFWVKYFASNAKMFLEWRYLNTPRYVWCTVAICNWNSKMYPWEIKSPCTDLAMLTDSPCNKTL